MAESTRNNGLFADGALLRERGQAVLPQTRRFVRIPYQYYLADCLHLPFDSLEIAEIEEDQGYDFYLAFNPEANHDYLIRAQEGSAFLRNTIKNAMNDQGKFLAMIKFYSSAAAYRHPEKMIPQVLNLNRTFFEVDVHQHVTHALLAVAEAARNDPQFSQVAEPNFPIHKETINNLWRGNLPVEIAIEDIRLLTRDTLEEKDRFTALCKAIGTLYILILSRLWLSGNQSRSMNYFNVLLEKLNFKPISHGVIDYAAHTLKPADFIRYVLFVMRDVEGQKSIASLNAST